MEMSTAVCFFGLEKRLQYVKAQHMAEGQSRFWELSNNRESSLDTGASWIDLAIRLFLIKYEAAVALYLLKSLESI